MAQASYNELIEGAIYVSLIHMKSNSNDVVS